jgi:phosphoglycerate dehydrogenase-like enzyme
MRNVVLTPHLGYVVDETMRRFYAQSVENILAYLDGAPIRVVAA